MGYPHIHRHKQPRLLFFSPGHNEPGGSATRARRLSQDLAERGWRVLAITRAATATRPTIRRKGLVTTIEVPGFRQRFAVVLYLAVSLAAGLTRGRGAHFLAMQLNSTLLAAGTTSAWWRRPCVVLTTVQAGEIEEITASRLRLAHLYYLRRAYCVVAQTQGGAAAVRRHLPDGCVAVIPNPLPPRHMTPLTGLPHATFSGRLSNVKGLDTLMQAWSAVLARRADARLTLIGGDALHGPAEADLRSFVASHGWGPPTVTFTGEVSDPRPYVQSADVYVHPSRLEGMSNALLEACAWGRVIVASDIAPNREVLGEDYPLLFITDDVRHLAEMLLAAFTDNAVRRRALAAISRRWHLMATPSAAERLESLMFASTGYSAS